jgi:hypothetical protein
VGEILCWPCLSPIFRAGWVWGWGWLGPSLSFVLANVRVGAGARGNPYKWQISLILCPKLYVPRTLYPTLNPYTTQTASAFDNSWVLSPPPIPVLLRPDGLLVLLPMEVWKDEIIRNVNDIYSYTNPHLHDKILENDGDSYKNTSYQCLYPHT